MIILIILKKGLNNIRPFFIYISIIILFFDDLSASSLDIKYNNSFIYTENNRNLMNNAKFTRNIDIEKIRLIYLIIKKNKDFYLNK
jgi:hypothetical protein